MIDYKNLNNEIKELEKLKSIRESYIKLLNNHDFKKVFSEYLFNDYLKKEVKNLSKVFNLENKTLIQENLFAISKLQSILESLLLDDLDNKLAENEKLIEQKF